VRQTAKIVARILGRKKERNLRIHIEKMSLDTEEKRMLTMLYCNEFLAQINFVLV
jgi:hypothetical protein